MRRFLACAPLALVMLGSCGEGGGDGIVEVYWQFDDAELERLYPLGELPDTCELESRSGIDYALLVRLTIARNTEACAEDWANPDCQVIAPITFSCDRFRGTALSVPVSAEDDGSDPGYLMVVEAVIDPTDTEPFVPERSCLAGPGPRVRRVKPGRITDLEIYQFIVLAIDIEAQRQAEDTAPEDVPAEFESKEEYVRQTLLDFDDC